MEINNYLFDIPEIEEIILSYLNTPIDFFCLMLINKYYYEIVNKNKIFLEFDDFHKKQPILDSWHHALLHDEELHKKFLQVCHTGHQYVAKYLLAKHTNKINIHVHNDFFFLWSCSHGRIEIAKWLYSLDGKTNIHVMNELAYKQSCKNGHTKVALWLASICDKYKLTIVDNKIVDYSF